MRPQLRRSVTFAVAALILCTRGALLAQNVSSQHLSLPAAVDLALRNYPALRESRARAEAANATVAVAETAYLPRLDALIQINRATHNNVFGLLLPQSVVPPISGPVLGTGGADSVWGTAAGVLLSWDAIDFGVRKANIDVARSQTDATRAQTELTQLDVAAAAADAFLTVLASDEGVRAAQANVERLTVFAQAVTALVRNELRPGADESRATAELALARNQVSVAVQQRDLARATLAAMLGAAGTDITANPQGLADAPATAAAGAAVDAHPAVKVDLAAIEAIRARERSLGRVYFPRLTLQGALSGRGTGAEVPGVLTDGSPFRTPNWALGATVNFPVFDIFNAQARKRVELHNEAAAQARVEQTRQNITTEQARARALLTAATEIARNTPVARDAAVDAASRARARYDAGLASITEVAEAQRLLAQADADDAVARLGIWRALLAAAQAGGDLRPFLSQVAP
jgi:outer membrane protein